MTSVKRSLAVSHGVTMKKATAECFCMFVILLFHRCLLLTYLFTESGMYSTPEERNIAIIVSGNATSRRHHRRLNK